MPLKLPKNYQLFLQGLQSKLDKDSIYTDDLRTFAWGTDASFYRQIPKIVIRTKSEADVSAVVSEASRRSIPLTFRAAGTALSGQSLTDSVLVVAGKNWEGMRIHDEKAEVVSLQPGLVGGKVNAILSGYGRKLGPDPASIESAMMGGIISNNSSGMSCGVIANSDKTLISARIVLADGTILDTGNNESREAFKRSHPDFIKAILNLREEVLRDEELTARIRRKYSIKNVTGLNILPLVTYEDPFDIIAHSIVGSEGTLAFLAEATMRTLEVPVLQASALIYFKSITEAARAVVQMRKLQINAAELLDKRSLIAVNDPKLNECQWDDLTAVLTQVTAGSREELEERIAAVKEALSCFDTAVEFSTDKDTCAKYWAIRSGIFPMVGGLRKQGTTCLIEDVAFPIESLPQATADLSALLDKHGYEDSCIYGHALDGNFHFIINQAFDSDAEVARYEALIRDTAALVVEKYDGSLKAEHGTGRNMASFVPYEWGDKAYGVMKRLKAIFDPQGILNPGVIFNDDPRCFLRDLKALPVLEPGEGAPKQTYEIFAKINKCIECGFCEVNCVSCGFSLSSRTRIAVMREIARLRNDGSDPERMERLVRSFRYSGIDTCAADGLCSTSCPMGINVADLTHELRRLNISSFSRGVWSMAAEHYSGVRTALKATLSLAQAGRAVLGDKAMAKVCSGLHKSIGIPLWTPSFPGPNHSKLTSSLPDPDCSTPASSRAAYSRPKVVYFPSCLNRTMGVTKNDFYKNNLTDETVSLLEKAGYEVVFPQDMDGLCCGMMWESKGMPDLAEKKLRELEEALLKASNNGEYPVLCDQSPCLHRMKTNISALKLYEPCEFIWTFLRSRLDFTKLPKTVAVHVTCSTRLMGLADTMVKVAGLCADNVVVPEGIGCCGFAGDKGMTHPELNEYALRKLRAQVKDIEVGYSNSRTCEIGLHHNSGIPYVSIIYLVNSCTVKKAAI